MQLTRNQRIAMAAGALAAVLLGVGVAMGLLARDRTPDGPPPASVGGLVVETTGGEEATLDPARPLRCFVDGQYVGMETLSACARRNGVATGSLDVGIDASGQLAAADDVQLAPLTPAQIEVLTPPPLAVPAVPVQPAPQRANTPRGPTGVCQRYAGADWRPLPDALTLNACMQTLFAGKCERPGGATYGRWQEQTMRLVPGRVEISPDNRSFRTLAEQTAGSCNLPEI